MSNSTPNKCRQLNRFIKLTGYFIKYSVKDFITAKGATEKKQVLAKVMLAIELTVVLMIYRKAYQDVADMLIAMVQSEEDFGTITDYLYGFSHSAMDNPESFTNKTEDRKDSADSG